MHVCDAILVRIAGTRRIGSRNYRCARLNLRPLRTHAACGCRIGRCSDWLAHVLSLPLWLTAGLWGLLAGSALLIGAAGGYAVNVSQRMVAAIMAFGSGVLISALCFDLMDEAYRRGGFDSTAIGFL